jgi:hypothetical protein
LANAHIRSVLTVLTVSTKGAKSFGERLLVR